MISINARKIERPTPVYAHNELRFKNALIEFNIPKDTEISKISMELEYGIMTIQFPVDHTKKPKEVKTISF